MNPKQIIRESVKGTHWSRLSGSKSLEAGSALVDILGLTSFFSYSINRGAVCPLALCSVRFFKDAKPENIFHMLTMTGMHLAELAAFVAAGVGRCFVLDCD